MPDQLIGIVGVATLLGIAVLFSTNRSAISLRIVGSAFALQVALAVFILRFPVGRSLIEAASAGVQSIVEFSAAGINMVFGTLADTSAGISFAVHVLPIIVFFSALMAVLYHIGIMQIIVRVVGGAMRWIIGTRKVESLNAAANIFVGQTESPLVVKPFLKDVTDAQLFAIMVSGVASVAGTVLAAYAQMGVRLDYLLAASFMAAPGGLLMAKIIMPDEPDDAEAEQREAAVSTGASEHENIILAAASGAGH